MNSKTGAIALLAAIGSVPAALQAQYDFKVANRDVQIHSFATQGFMESNQNNYMSMPTSKGSFAFTDGGGNISTQVTDKFRVGAQVYLRNVGEFGNWKPELDWAFGAYKFTSWFGVKAGKVKTVQGLFNDVQDMDSLHTFALLPQSIYPTDWRSTSIAHSGGDVYGDINAKHLGTFSYTGYAGMRPHDNSSGYQYAAKAVSIFLDDLGGLQTGGDLRWTTPFGAIFGTSYRNEDITGHGTTGVGAANVPYSQNTNSDELVQYYGQYGIKGFRVDVEYSRNIRDLDLLRDQVKFVHSAVDVRAWYIAGTYQVSKRLELGAYRSVYDVDARKDTTPPAQHEYDTTVSGRVNLTGHWYLKVEGHFIDGAPTSPSASRGFYALSNPTAILPATELLVLRTGISF